MMDDITRKRMAEEKIAVQIIPNYLIKEHAPDFPVLAREVDEQDRYSKSSWYNLSPLAFHQ
ncbi:hypothetical protein [Syntrophomonas curvata]